MPEKMRNCILHASLTEGPLLIMASDCIPVTGLIKGNSVSLSLVCNSDKEIRRYYKMLSLDGMATNPPAYTYWGTLFGGLTDKFGIHWLLYCSKTGDD